MRQDIAQGMSAEEQRQQERQNARVEAAADAAAATAIAAKNLEAKLTKLATTSPDVAI
jgi:hypothetical protein